MNLEELTIRELLLLQSSAIEELKKREVVRTMNNPVGDYTEWLVATKMRLILAKNSSVGYDATDSNGQRIQIKGRRIASEKASRQLSPIRKLEDRDFDLLVAVIFDKDYEVIHAAKMPHDVIRDYASYTEHSNAHILQLRGKILEDPRVDDITSIVSG